MLGCNHSYYSESLLPLCLIPYNHVSLIELSLLLSIVNKFGFLLRITAHVFKDSQEIPGTSSLDLMLLETLFSLEFHLLTLVFMKPSHELSEKRSGHHLIHQLSSSSAWEGYLWAPHLHSKIDLPRKILYIPILFGMIIC